MPHYEKFQSFKLEYLSSAGLVDFSTEFELRLVRKERAAFVITFAIKHAWYFFRITTRIIHKQVRNVENETFVSKYFGYLPSEENLSEL